MTGSVIVLGGGSEIGSALALRLVRGGAREVVLAARRHPAEAERALTAAGARVTCVDFDADDLAAHGPLLGRLVREHAPVATVVVAFGILGDQAKAERDVDHAVAVVHTDYVAQVSVLTVLANLLRAQGSGDVVAFSSVAGVRVRRANYVYGSAKAGLDGFASGLSDALVGSGVRLLVVRPGFVVGRMTEGMSPAPLSSTPDQVADAAAKALRRGGRDVWVPGALRVLFFGLRLLPRWLWRRMPR
ncbi:SDR family NAD(P)-dependent oxidoreductase [Actinokineospora bangkokensis]|uniref:Oxidoreductase n=1 Tax=Actinokineospora bangkokensis TaxID=1193682 RepID=A0A1Q9LGW6_9PSEU|nr:SDR family NAD(P)-dependent oxidoreductase [Actinokineospora bangkokensis]OLR91291.1 oxidoreductase [Actinokineospora bangkokensis]